MDVMDIRDFRYIMDIMDIMKITAWMAIRVAVWALVFFSNWSPLLYGGNNRPF